MKEFIVTKAAERPALPDDGKCFYCRRPIGSPHDDDCVLVQKRVKVRLIVEYETKVPASWDKDTIEFHRNESSWCMNNAMDELDRLYGQEDGPCLCDVAKIEYIEDAGEPYLDED